MKNNSMRLLWSTIVPVTLCAIFCGCKADVDTSAPAAGSGAATPTGASDQNTNQEQVTAVTAEGTGTNGGGGGASGAVVPEQPTGSQVAGSEDLGEDTPPQTMVDGGAPDGNTGTNNTPQQADASKPNTPVQPVGDGQTCLQPGDGSYAFPGPYNVARIDNVDLASLLPAGTAAPTTYSIWHPDPLEPNCPHPIVAWGNGTTVEGPDVYDFFNRNAASWGIVVIGSNNSNVGSGAYHRAGLDYLLQQNQDSSSKFYQKLSERGGTAGHSQGGMGATAASNHANVYAEVSVAGGGIADSKVAIICLTGTEDFVNGPCVATANGAAGPAFIASWQGGDHVTTETLAGYIAQDPGTLQMQRFYAGWFRCFLADDPVACGMFKGSPCGVCNDPGWAQIEGRNM